MKGKNPHQNRLQCTLAFSSFYFKYSSSANDNFVWEQDKTRSNIVVLVCVCVHLWVEAMECLVEKKNNEKNFIFVFWIVLFVVQLCQTRQYQARLGQVYTILKTTIDFIIILSLFLLEFSLLCLSFWSVCLFVHLISTLGCRI